MCADRNHHGHIYKVSKQDSELDRSLDGLGTSVNHAGGGHL